MQARCGGGPASDVGAARRKDLVKTLVGDGFPGVKSHFIDGQANSHFLPVVVELLPAIETYDVSAIP